MGTSRDEERSKGLPIPGTALIRFDPFSSSNAKGGMCKPPLRANRTWVSYKKEPFANLSVADNPAQSATVWSLNALKDNAETASIDDLGLPHEATISFEPIYEDYESERVQRFQHCFYPVRWVGGGQVEPAEFADGQDTSEAD